MGSAHALVAEGKRRAMKAGYVYILYNPSIEGVVKIGSTSGSSEARAAQISGATGIPTAFLVVHEEYVRDCKVVEQRLHTRFGAVRVNPRREFFRVPLKEAVKALQEVAVEFRPESSEGLDHLPGQVEEMFPTLRHKYPTYLKPEIKSIKLVQKSGLCFLEVTSQVHVNLNDERVERVDLSFISEGDYDDLMFTPIRSAQENAKKFIGELDRYSIIMCTPLFTDQACKEIARQYKSPGT
jgi:hypothetical protein